MYFALALVPAFLYGSMGIILLKVGGDARQHTLGVALGSFVSATVLALVLGLDTDSTSILVAFCAGIVVGLASYLQISAFHKIGVSRVMPLTTGGQLLGISLLGILLFGEWLGSAALPVGLVGLALIILGVMLTSWQQKPTGGFDEGGDVVAVPYDPVAVAAPGKGSPTPVDTRPKQLVSGLIDTGLSTLFYIAFPIIIRYWEVDPLRSFFYQAFGILLVGFIVSFPFFTKQLGRVDTRWSKYTLAAMIPGGMWGLGVVIMQFSQVKVGVAVGFSLSQLSVIIATFGGIWILGEKRTRKEMVAISLGVLVLVVGALLLGVAKSLDVA